MKGCPCCGKPIEEPIASLRKYISGLIKVQRDCEGRWRTEKYGGSWPTRKRQERADRYAARATLYESWLEAIKEVPPRDGLCLIRADKK